MTFFMPKGFDYFKLLGKRLHQGAVFVRFFGEGWQDVLIIGIGEHSAQYALPDEALVIVECTGRAEYVEISYWVGTISGTCLLLSVRVYTATRAERTEVSTVNTTSLLVSTN